MSLIMLEKKDVHIVVIQIQNGENILGKLKQGLDLRKNEIKFT